MKIKIDRVSNPFYSKKDKSSIDCTIEIGGIKHPFTATPNDSEFHGQKLWNNLNSGIYGPIAEYQKP